MSQISDKEFILDILEFQNNAISVHSEMMSTMNITFLRHEVFYLFPHHAENPRHS